MLKVTHMWEGISNLLRTSSMNSLELIFICIGTLPIKLSPLIFLFHSSFPLSFYMLTFRKTFVISRLYFIDWGEQPGRDLLWLSPKPVTVAILQTKELKAQRLQEVVTQFNYFHPPVPGAPFFLVFCLA